MIRMSMVICIVTLFGVPSCDTRSIKGIGYCNYLTVLKNRISGGKIQIVEDYLEKLENTTFQLGSPFLQLRDHRILPANTEEYCQILTLLLMRPLISPQVLEERGDNVWKRYLETLKDKACDQFGSTVWKRNGHGIMWPINTRDIVHQKYEEICNRDQKDTTDARRAAGNWGVFDVNVISRFFSENSKMKLHICPPTHHIILSDFPMFISGDFSEEKKIIRWFPISKQLYISISGSYDEHKIELSSTDDVQWFNTSLAKSAYKYLFSSKICNEVQSLAMSRNKSTNIDYQ